MNWLKTKRAKEIYAATISEMQERGIHSDADNPSIAVYADAVAKFEEVTRILQKEGYVYKDKNGVERRHMLLPLENTLATRIKDFAYALGITPLGRKKIGIDTEPQEEAEQIQDPFNVRSISASVG